MMVSGPRRAYFHQELEAGARHRILPALHRTLRAGNTGHVASAQVDHPHGFLLVHVAGAGTVGRGVMHGDHTQHIQRPLRQPECVGNGELVVYLVRGVAVEDYARLVHELLSCRDLAWLRRVAGQ